MMKTKEIIVMPKFWSNIERKRRKYINTYYRKFRKELNDLVIPVMEFFKYSNDYDNLIASIPALVKTDKVNALLVEMYGTVGRDFASNIKDSINRKRLKEGIATKDLDEDLWDEFMQEWAMREAGIKIVSINNYTKDEFIRLIREQITYGHEYGLGRDQIADRIYKQLPKEWNLSTYWKAQRIAQTEVIGASNRASFEAASRTGYNMTKTWLTAPLGLAKNERHALPGAIMQETVQMHEKFKVDGGNGYEDMDCPGDANASPENVINCRCTITYEII